MIHSNKDAALFAGFTGDVAALEREVMQLRSRVADLNTEAVVLKASVSGTVAQQELIQQLRAANQNLLLATFGAQDRQATAEAANHAKQEFLAMLAHELRNPLAPIAMATALLGKLLAADPQLPKIHQVLCRQTDNLTRLVDELLDASRMNTGKITLQKRVMLLAPVIEAALETVRPLVEKRSQTLQLALPEMPVLIEGDPIRLAQALANLLLNASKFSAEHQSILLAVELVDGLVSLSVKDQGSGISAEIMPLIFDLFTQGSDTPDRPQGGLGIGLALVKMIVNLHRGTVTARSAGRGFGSEFVVTLPVASAEQAREFGSTEKLTNSQLARILIIGDNGDANETLKNFLVLEGYHVTSAASGTDGLMLAQDSQFDVVICDIGMPGMDGYEVVKRLRRDIRPTPYFIALTGYNQVENRIRAIEVGFDHYLVKPVVINLLLNVIGLGVRA